MLLSNTIKTSFILLIFAAFSSCKKDQPANTSAQAQKLFQTGDFFSGSNWNDPHVLHDGSQFVMYASASQNFDENIKIYRLVSPDGMSWSLNPQQAVLERTPGAWDGKSVETPAVVYFSGRYHLFYTGYPTSYQDAYSYKIGHAVSTDGINWQKDSSFLLGPTNPTGAPNLDFNQFVVAEPGPVVYNGKIYLYFSAIGANAALGTTYQVIGLTTYDGHSWTSPVAVLEPDQAVYPRSTYVGFSTPNAIVRNNTIHLYCDIVKDNPWKQVKIHHASSPDGMHNWTQDNTALLNREDFDWTQDEIRSPAVIDYNNSTYLYFAGNAGLNLAIGLKKY